MSGRIMDINVVVANNIMKQMKKTDTKQIELANAVGIKKKVMSKMLNGSRMINISELRRIADYFHVSTDDLMESPTPAYESNVMMIFIEKVSTDAAREALHTVNELADMIIYHANVRENALAMSETWKGEENEHFN